MPDHKMGSDRASWFGEENDFVALSRSQAGESKNIVAKLEDFQRRLENCFEIVWELEEFVEAYEAGEEDLQDKDHRYIYLCRKLTEHFEFFWYLFPGVIDEDWFSDFYRLLRLAHQSAEPGGRFEEEFHFLHRVSKKIVQFNSGPSEQSPLQKMDRFSHRRGMEFMDLSLLSEFDRDMAEARDLVAIGYHQTALFVLGRAIEKALRILGEDRQIESVSVHGNARRWERTTFKHMCEALKNVDRPGGKGKMLNQKQYHQVSSLIQYRNDTAHSEHGNLDREEARHEIRNASRLLVKLSDQIREMRKQDLAAQIEPVTDQKIS